MNKHFEPRISAHKIIESEVLADSKEVGRWVIGFIRRSRKFYLGSITDVSVMANYDTVLANIPFPYTYLEFNCQNQANDSAFREMLGDDQAENARIFKDNCKSANTVYMCWRPEDEESIARGVRFSFSEIGYTVDNRGYTFCTPNTFVTEVRVEGENILISTGPGPFSRSQVAKDPTYPIEMTWAAFKIMSVNALLRCKNIHVETVEPPKALNAARTKRGRPTFMSYHVLSLSPERRTSGVSSGREHSAPCFHWRRGHIREYTPGMFTYVTAHTVGSPETGYIIKDYKTA